MKLRYLLFFFALIFTAEAQQTQPVATPQPNCLLNISLQTAGQNSPVFDNRQVGCLDWTVAVAVPTTISALQLVVQTAQDNGVAGCVGCSWSTFTAATGSNPNTNTAGWNATFVTATSVYYGYLRVQLVSVTGTGSVTGKLFSYLTGSGGGGGGGTGTVTQVNTACGIGGGPFTTSGTITRLPIISVQSGASYPFASSDCGNVVELTNAAPTPTIAQAGTAGFTANWFADSFCAAAAGCTLTPTTSTINGAASITWAQNQTIRISSNGTNYLALFVPGSGGGSDQNGTPWSCISASASGTTYTCALTPTLTAYAVNMFVDFIPDVTNTGASTLNIDGLGTRAIEKLAIPSGVGAASLIPLTANDLIAGLPYTLRANGNPVNSWILQQPYTQVSINTVANAGNCTDTSGTPNTITCSSVVAFSVYAKGQAVDLILANSVSGATTINVNGIGAKAVTYNGTTTMASGVMVAGGTYRLAYDGTEFVLQGSVSVGTGPTTNQNVRTIGASFGSFQSGATALSAAATACVPVYFSGTIQAVHLIGDVSGSITIDVKTVLHASWTGTASTSSITAADIPALSSAAAYTDTTLTGWTTSLAANTDVCFVMSSPTTVAGASITLKVAAN